MKQFLNVLSFELSNYFKNKGYMITTILFSILLIIGLSLPSFFNMSKLIPQLDQNSTESIESVEEISEEDKKSFVIIDNNNIFENLDILESAFLNSKWTKVTSLDEAEELIKLENVEAGFSVDSLTKYSYLVNNSGFTDTNQMIFENLLSSLGQQVYANEDRKSVV